MKTPSAIEIKELRLKSGLTQKKCEELLGLERGAFTDTGMYQYSMRYFNAWENDKMTMSPYLWYAFKKLVKDNQ